MMSRRFTVVIGVVALSVMLVTLALWLVACGDSTPVPVQTQGVWADYHAFHTSAVTNANGTAMSPGGLPLVRVQVQGITTGTINFEATTDGTNWDVVEAIDPSNGSKATTMTADGQFWVPSGGAYQIRCRISGYGGGDITVTGYGVTAGGLFSIADVILGANSGVDVGDVTLNNTEDITVTLDGEAVDVTTSVDFTVTLDSEVVAADVTGQGDVPVTLDSESVTVTTSVDFTVTLDSEVVAVDATGQGDVPVSTSRDFTVTLDSEVVSVDATGQGDVPITLDSEAVVLGAGAAEVGSLYTSTNQIGDVRVLGYNSSTWRDVRVDESTDSWMTTDFAHHEIHAGNGYAVHLFDVDWDKNDTLNVAFTTPDSTKWIHMFPIVDATGITTFTIMEDCTVTAGSGVAYLALNRNRNAVGTLTSTVLSLAASPVAGEVSLNVTITGVGTAVHEEVFGEGKKGGSSEGGRDQAEYVLRQNTTYCFDMQHVNLGDDDTLAAMELSYYEHADLVAPW